MAAKITIEELSESAINALKADLSTIENKIKIIQEKVRGINIDGHETIKYDLVVFLNECGIDVTIDDDVDVLIGELDNLIAFEGNATEADVLSGKTFMNETGEVLTGNIPINDSTVVIPGVENQILPAGYYSNSSVVLGDVNLLPENIKKGVTIFGVEGTVEESNVTNIHNKQYDVASGTTYLNNKEIGRFTVPYTGVYEFITTYYHYVIPNYVSHLGFDVYVNSINTNNGITGWGTTGTGDKYHEKKYTRYSLNANDTIIITTTTNVNSGSYEKQGYGYYIVKVNYVGN